MGEGKSSDSVTWLARVQRVVLQNIGLKTFSLLVAIALFTVVHGSEAGQRSLHVPVVALLPPESSGKVLVGEIPDKVKLTLSGSRSVLNSIDSVDPVQIDLTDGRRYFYFEPGTFGLPAGINVQVTPAALTLEWETRLERKLAVRPQVSGAPNAALELADKPVATPAKVTVSGPRSVVEAMTEVLTEPVSLAELPEGAHRRRVPLLTLPKHVTASQTSEINVDFTLEAKRAQRRLRRLPITAVGVAGPVSVRPLNVDVVVAAPERTLEELDPEHVVPVVELAGINLSSGVVSVPVKLRGLNESVRVLRIEPSEALVRVR
jgi:YbbR domain-containing protein